MPVTRYLFIIFSFYIKIIILTFVGEVSVGPNLFIVASDYLRL